MCSCGEIFPIEKVTKIVGVKGITRCTKLDTASAKGSSENTFAKL